MAALPPGACPVWMGSNHDLGRFPSRWCGGDERKTRLALLVLATLPGTSVLYYGDEIGMTDVDVPVALRRDTATLDVLQGADRDPARTPMPWDGSPGGGFTGPGVTPWLPLGDPPLGSVADQRDDAGSALSLCRDLLSLRRAEIGADVAGFENLSLRAGQPVDLQSAPSWRRTSPASRPSTPAAAGEVLLNPARARTRRLASCAPGKGSSRAQRDERPARRSHLRVAEPAASARASPQRGGERDPGNGPQAPVQGQHQRRGGTVADLGYGGDDAHGAQRQQGAGQAEQLVRAPAGGERPTRSLAG